MMYLIIAAAWVSTGLTSYHVARRSWISRYGTDDAPFGYVFAAFAGIACVGFVVAEWCIGNER